MKEMATNIVNPGESFHVSLYKVYAIYIYIYKHNFMVFLAGLVD